MNHQQRTSHPSNDGKAGDPLLMALLQSTSSPQEVPPSQIAAHERMILPDQKHQQDELMAEYHQIRNEIIQNDVLSLQIITFIILLTGALMGFAFSEHVQDDILRAALFLMSEVIAFIGSVQNMGRIRNTYIAGSYIKTFIEPKTTHIRWEDRLAKFRERPKKYGGMNVTIHQRLIYIIIICANASLASRYLLKAVGWSTGSITFLTCLIVMTILVLVFLWRQYADFDNGHTKKFDQIWTKIKEEEEL